MYKGISHRYFTQYSRYVIRKTAYSEWTSIYWFVLSQVYDRIGEWKDFYPNSYPLFQTKSDAIEHADKMIAECKKQGKFVIEQSIDSSWRTV